MTPGAALQNDPSTPTEVAGPIQMLTMCSKDPSWKQYQKRCKRARKHDPRRPGVRDCAIVGAQFPPEGAGNKTIIGWGGTSAGIGRRCGAPSTAGDTRPLSASGPTQRKPRAPPGVSRRGTTP